MNYMLIALMLLLLCVSAQQVQAAANFTGSSSQNVKVLIENAIISLRNGDPQGALSNLTLADRLLGGSVYSGAPQVIR
ncbi:MAG: hypothetical protein WCF23_02305 [Candidatus Nitrosopolaris sp.]